MSTPENLWKLRHECDISVALEYMGQYAGSAVLLYDENGSGIRNPAELLEWTADGTTGFIVECDMHN